MSKYMFNIDNGYLEGLLRGFKGGILKQADYLNLVQCETLEGKQSLMTSDMIELVVCIQYHVMCIKISVML